MKYKSVFSESLGGWIIVNQQPEHLESPVHSIYLNMRATCKRVVDVLNESYAIACEEEI